MAKEKNFTAQTVRVPHELEKPLGYRMVDTGESFQAMVLRLLKGELAKPEAGEVPLPSPKVANMPGLLDELSDDQVWTVQNLVDILKHQPQGSIFRSLDLTLQLAITEFRKMKSAHEAAHQKAPRESPKSAHRKPTGTGRNH